MKLLSNTSVTGSIYIKENYYTKARICVKIIRKEKEGK
jgi:hypothetical protein